MPRERSVARSTCSGRRTSSRRAKSEGREMDWNIIEGKWKELKGRAREEWGKLTNDELEEIGGKKDRLVGKLQQKYGYASDEADRRADEWAKHQDVKPEDVKRQDEASKV